MSSSIDVSGESGVRLTITIYDYENPAAQNASDANWLTCDVAITIRSFAATHAPSLTTRDLEVFRDELRLCQEVLSGTATLSTDEDEIQIVASFDRLGRVTVSGVLRCNARPSAALTFSFDSDQSRMAATLKDLDHALATFPKVVLNG